MEIEFESVKMRISAPAHPSATGICHVSGFVFIHLQKGAAVFLFFLVADTQLYKRLCPSVRPSVGWSVGEHELKSGKTRISAPAHPSATDGRVSGLVRRNEHFFFSKFSNFPTH